VKEWVNTKQMVCKHLVLKGMYDEKDNIDTDSPWLSAIAVRLLADSEHFWQ
jgi:hypothetical protein